jgi:hypothetical protein
MSEADEVELNDAVLSAVREQFQRHGIVANHIVLLAETIEADGQIALRALADGEVSGWQSLGMLEWAAVRERAGAMRDDD